MERSEDYAEYRERTQPEYDRVCKALSNGEKGYALAVGRLYFGEGRGSQYLTCNAEELLEIMKQEEAECESSDLACLLGGIYDSGVSEGMAGVFVQEDAAEAEKWYRKGYEKGSLDAGFCLAQLLQKTNRLQEYAALLEELCGKGCDMAFYRLSICCKEGIGVEQDLTKASRLRREYDRREDEKCWQEIKRRSVQ